MSFSLDAASTRRLGSLTMGDLIEFESQQIDKDIFVVVSVDKDDSIPALLLQLWKFEGGYNHSFKNVVENDLGINTQVPYFEPDIYQAVIEQIVNYRPTSSSLSPKEELFFDVWPDVTQSLPSEEYSIPFEVEIRYSDGRSERIHLPSWTPIQKLPLNRIQSGSEVEIWGVNGLKSIMKVTSL